MDIVMRSHERRVRIHEEKLPQQQLERDKNPYSFSIPAILDHSLVRAAIRLGVSRAGG